MHQTRYIMDFMCFLYCVSSAYINQSGLKKLGLTIHPVHRMSVYNTGDPPNIGLEKRYDGLWQVNAKSKSELLQVEKRLHTHFNSARQLRVNGNYTEWFSISFEEVAEFLNGQEYVIRQLSIEEVTIIQERSERNTPTEDTHEFLEEKTLIAEQEEVIRSTRILPLKEKFFNTFLKGKSPRRIQDELWDTFEGICANDTLLDSMYTGIIQWPTGTGKTIAILLLIVLAKERCKRIGTIYTGLLVSPRNDIFNTISTEFNKLSDFGIRLYDGSNGKLSSLIIPTNHHALVMACPQSLINDETGMKRLSNIAHLHFDEVHRSTGELYFQLLKKMLPIWKTQFLTGSSATPKTSDREQHRKLAELFGDPCRIIHKCDVDEAVREGWIATPRFTVSTTPKNQGEGPNHGAYIKALVLGISNSIQSKKDRGLWRGGKVIAYLPSIDAAKSAAVEARNIIPEASIYLAIGERTDREFVDSPADGSIRLLFACDRYREGSDIKGLDMTAVLIGKTISAYILIQIQGRSLRTDYAGKEGWCLIVSPCEEDETEQNVLDRIALNILTFIGDNRPLVKCDIEKYVETYFGDVLIEGTVISKDETVARIQAAYERTEYSKRTPKERYDTVRRLNIELGIRSKNEYESRASEHSKYVEDPKSYFKDWWVSWYHFLGVDTSAFPPTKSEWTRVCKEMGITSWTQYKEKNSPILPLNPGQMYEDYTNPDKEFEVEEYEHIY